MRAAYLFTSSIFESYWNVNWFRFAEDKYLGRFIRFLPFSYCNLGLFLAFPALKFAYFLYEKRDPHKPLSPVDGFREKVQKSIS